jgi:hypothetical protein
MFDKNFDPFAILEDLQNQLHHMAINQQHMAQNAQHLQQTVMRQADQINHLIHLNTLANQKTDLVKQDLERRIAQLNASSTTPK